MEDPTVKAHLGLSKNSSQSFLRSSSNFKSPVINNKNHIGLRES